MKQFFWLLTVFFTLLAPLAASQASPRLCDPNFGRVGRTLPRFCQVLPKNQLTTPPTTSFTRFQAPQPVSATVEASFEPYSLSGKDFSASDTIDLGVLHIHHRNQASYRTFQPAVRLFDVTFRLSEATSPFLNTQTDFQDFVVVAGGQALPVNAFGEARLEMGGRRLASGEDLSVNIAIRAKNAATLPAYSGTLRLEITEINAQKQTGAYPQSISVALGETTSRAFAFGRLSSVLQTGNTVNVRVLQTDPSKNVFQNEVLLFPVRIEPTFSDVSLRQLIVRQVDPSLVAENVFSSLKLVNMNTGKVLDEAFFDGNRAIFRLGVGEAVFPLNQNTELAVVASVKEDASPVADFRLGMTETDWQFESLTSGNAVSASNIALSVPSQSFSLEKASLRFDMLENNRRKAVVGVPESVFSFAITNQDQKGIELSRFSTMVIPQGVDFAGGLDASDFMLYETTGDRRFDRSPSGFTPSVASALAKVDFTATSPLYFAPGQQRTFDLAVALQRSGQNDGDEVIIAFMEDPQTQNGTLDSLMASGATPIWNPEDDFALWTSGKGLSMPLQSNVVPLP